MRNRILSLLGFIVAIQALAVPLFAVDRADYTVMIVPLTSQSVPGVNGSVWSSELRVFNASNFPLPLLGPDGFIGQPPPAVFIPPRNTEQVILSRRSSDVDGAFLYVPNPFVDVAKMSLRVRDTSQHAESLGTEIPVAHANDVSGDQTLIDVPTDPRYRATLRIYGWTQAPMQVGVTVYPESGDVAIVHYDVELNGIVNVVYDPFPPYPSYIALDPLTAVVRASGERVRIELTNYGQILSPPPPGFWALLSITNNETQQVTAITPK